MQTFTIGDEIKHRASGKHGIVVRVLAGQDFQPSGCYDVELDFGETAKQVNGMTIKKATDSGLLSREE